MKKIVTAFAAIVAATVLFVGCATTDVVQKYSKQSFSDILKTDPSLVSEGKNNDYILTVDGKTLLTVNRDYSKSQEDIVLSTPLQPFINAGLDVSKLGKGYRADKTNLYLVTDFGKGTGEKNTPEQALFESVTADRKALTYHQALDHYGIVLNGGIFISALAGFPNALPFGKRKSARYAREIKSLSKEHHRSDIMTSVQAVKTEER